MKYILTAAMILGLATFSFGQKTKPLEDGTILEWKSELRPSGLFAFTLMIKTKEVYDCKNYELPLTHKIADGKLTVTVKGVAEPTDCQSGLGPAYGMVPLEGVIPGQYDSKIWVNRQDFHGTLTMSSTGASYRLDPATDKDLMKMPNAEIFAVPMGHVWGSIEFNKPELQEQVDRILGDFRNEGASKASLKTGDYGYFYFHADGTTPMQKLEKGWDSQPFVFQYAGDPDRLALIRKMYLDKFGNDLRIRLFHTSGKRWE